MKNLKSYNTFGVDVCCSRYVEFRTADDLKNIAFEGRWYVLGGGSNTLFCCDFDGLILHAVSNTIEVVEQGCDFVMVRADAGVVWDDFVRYCVDNSYYGAENLSWIPGSVGASPVQNIGAYGSEAKDIIHHVEYYDILEKCVKTIQAHECAFGYRDSIFKNALKDRVVVLSVVYRLDKTFTPNVKYGNITAELDADVTLTAKLLRETIVKIRKAKLPDPDVIGNGGSFFKNPIVSQEKFCALQACYPKMPFYNDSKGVKIPAGWLIDTAGWKGFRDGAVGVHRDQALVLVNYGGGTGMEVIDLAHRIIADIDKKFGIALSPEINVLNNNQ